ncbi:enoyl-CoA hydratase mitochondrial precursor [Neurospora tetrasperma FGSC 2508]|uniref:Probable enoyl-CoA hydratase, mitochondrial n=1 Tax=Neurospora tetrasperma (strain FGSC 2508 / ATCC MYA-4615 / P0657) TaxID=510951 RepID=F8MKW6_NEUT8|nr:enoyl-CoA hydratase mitochondrial precursor [Neurospora tetrasperma FGSC 2508]EGO57494.1 enoyl-CoA hydratase mitochondrial precursor [Neurospora tetrasperma FGSC 2508]EGZ72246.1 enoyl-CoA hydratase mitochondrial precursor [Neurospora tetrasperma FGSC 2509]
MRSVAFNNTLRGLSRAGSRFQPATLPRVAAARAYSTPAESQYEFIQVSEPRPGVGQVTLNRPKALNALSTPLITELNSALLSFQQSPTIRAIVLTGSERAFAAGADIKEMAPLTFSKAFLDSFIESWSNLTFTVKKPIIGAVSGHALGGGCELALMTDIIYCTKTANFGQPEIKLGTIPGAGGSQRLTRAVGKSKAMELILTGKSFSGEEAERWGVAARAFDSYEELMEQALKTAETIAGYSKVAVQAAKEVVNKSQEVGLRDGVEYERRMFHALFGSQDQKIGMKAFAEKGKAKWVDE